MSETLDRNVGGFVLIATFVSMPVPFKLGKNISFTIPNSWDECSTDLFFKLAATDPTDYVAMLSILSGIDKKTLSNVKQLGLDMVLEPHLAWMGDKIDWKNIEPPKEIYLGIKKLKVPTDLDLESYGQKLVLDSMVDQCTKTEGEKSQVNMTKLIPYAFAVYFAHKYYDEDFDSDLVDKFLPHVGRLPIMTVYPIGAFFLRTYYGFGSSTLIDSLLKETTMRWLRKLRIWINSATSKLSTRWQGVTSSNITKF